MGGGGRVTWRSQPIVYTQYRVRLILLPVTPLLRFFLLFFILLCLGLFPPSFITYTTEKESTFFFSVW